MSSSRLPATEPAVTKPAVAERAPEPALDEPPPTPGTNGGGGTPAIASPSPRRRRRWPRRLGKALAVVAAFLLLAATIGYGVIVRICRIEPPAVPAAVRDAALRLPFSAHDGRTFVGDNWMGRRRGVWELHLAGDPFTLGYSHARLGSRLLVEQEDYMFGEMNRYVPSRVARGLIRLGVMLRYRGLGKLLPPERQEELAGLATGAVDLHGDFLPPFHRMVFYHALHDITQTLEHSPLLGCSAFAASGRATRDGHLIIGRNFDFEGPEIFDREKVVLFFRPTGKIPFASVAWTGMTGAVTGVNAEKIYVSINAARTDDPGQVGIPVEVLLRQILENARSIDDVINLVRAPVLVPDLYLVGDGKTGEAVVIERSPTRLEVRRLDPARGVVALTNHARSPAFAHDARNQHLERYLTSGARLLRLEELLAERAGTIDPAGALGILRDKRGAGDEALGLGNRNALDAIIATHSVVLDATNLVLWVGAGPHLTGRFVAFDLLHELGGVDRPPPADLPPDPIVDTDEYAGYRQAQAAMRAADQLRALGLDDRAIDQARVATAAEDRSPEAHKLLADLLWRKGDHDAARTEYRRFIALHPPHLADVEAARARLGGQ
jgi:hypothetical protein